MQLDRGLYGPLIIEDPAEPLKYEAEYVIVLDDWIDGLSGTPDDELAQVKRTMAGMDHGGMSGMGGTPWGATGLPSPTPTASR